MKLKRLVQIARETSAPYRVRNGKKFRLKDIDPADTGGYTSEDKPRAREALETGVQALIGLQEVLYAQDRWAVVLIFQAMDAAGKDGAIKHVMSGVKPAGVPGRLFQGTLIRGARSRLPLAVHESTFRPRAHRRLQPLVL